MGAGRGPNRPKTKAADARHAELRVGFGLRLIAFRYATGMTSSAFYGAAGIPIKAASHWENYRNIAAVDWALDLQEAHGVSLDFLYAGKTAGLQSHLAADVLKNLRALKLSYEKTGELPNPSEVLTLPGEDKGKPRRGRPRNWS